MPIRRRLFREFEGRVGRGRQWIVADEDVGFDRLATQHTQLVRELAEQYAAEVSPPQISLQLFVDTGS
jgi:hypothetical protein